MSDSPAITPEAIRTARFARGPFSDSFRVTSQWMTPPISKSVRSSFDSFLAGLRAEGFDVVEVDDENIVGHTILGEAYLNADQLHGHTDPGAEAVARLFEFLAP